MSEPTITVPVDVTNPGQFFACCGLLELADRLWPEAGVEGWFETSRFFVARSGALSDLLAKARQTEMIGDETEESAEEDDDEVEEDSKSPVKPLEFTTPVPLRLDWWQDINLKPWAGSMNARNIALAMCRAIDPDNPDPWNQSEVVPEFRLAASVRKTVVKPKEPFHLDGRRGANALGRDIGFIPDTLKKRYKTPMFAQPAAEFFALIGLQRARPRPTQVPRVYDYFTWSHLWRCRATILPLAVYGLLGDPMAQGYRFDNGFRTGQKKHKAYMPASTLTRGARNDD